MANHQLIINRFPVIINLVAIARGVSGQRLNRQLIVNRFPVIVNPASLNPSRIYQSRDPIHQFASEGSTSALAQQSSDRHPRIQPSDPTPMNSQLSATLRNQIRNRPAKLAGENIRKYMQPTWPVSATAEIYRLGRRQPTVRYSESTGNLPIFTRNLPIAHCPASG